MRYFIYYQNDDSNIQGIVAIISKNRCSSSDGQVFRYYVFAFYEHGLGRRINQRFWSMLIQTVSTVLLLIEAIRNLI